MIETLLIYQDDRVQIVKFMNDKKLKEVSYGIYDKRGTRFQLPEEIAYYKFQLPYDVHQQYYDEIINDLKKGEDNE